MNNNRNYRYESLKNLLYLSVWYYRCIFRSNMLFQICEPALILINNYIFLLNLFSIRLIYLHFWEYLINSHKYTCGNFFIFYLFIYFFVFIDPYIDLSMTFILTSFLPFQNEILIKNTNRLKVQIRAVCMHAHIIFYIYTVLFIQLAYIQWMEPLSEFWHFNFF